jgi:organic radical activating enzyme
MNTPICSMPWHAFYLKAAGEIHPCCHIKEPEGTKYTIQKDGLEAYEKSNFITDLKESLLAGNMHPSMCRVCIDQERSSIKSMRELEMEQLEQCYPEWTINDGYVKAQFIFDNSCNLKCIMCDSLYSSKWRQEYKDVYGIDNKPSKVDNSIIKDFFDKHYKSLRHIQISGGETFMGPLGRDSAFLDSIIKTGAQTKIDLFIETNGTLYPDQEIINKLLEFRSVKFNLSIDATGARGEYIRFPSVWDEHKQVIHQIKQLADSHHSFSLGIMHTLNIFNILYLPDFIKYARTLDKNPHIHIVHGPKHFSPHALTDALREKIGKILLKGKDLECLRWGKYLLESKYNGAWKDFLLYRDKHDLYRGTNFTKTFPELEELINGV